MYAHDQCEKVVLKGAVSQNFRSDAYEKGNLEKIVSSASWETRVINFKVHEISLEVYYIAPARSVCTITFQNRQREYCGRVLNPELIRLKNIFLVRKSTENCHNI